MKYRQMKSGDPAAFLENRMEFVSTIREMGDSSIFRRRTAEYLAKHIEREDLIVFLAIDEGKIAASCMACIFETVPLPSCPRGRSAEPLNVYTKKDFRRQGHAEKLLRLPLSEAKKRGVEKIVLEATEDGLSLYKKLGFTPLEGQMALRLS
ncbi:GNAT family N-acetyltransferase [Christensenella tenuis]|uniref:GNAT family N-acetyltransferase n=1 Tax=Christensenella tenuis TaxID=2763033 RepID=A0ABR7EHR1_9FIRM|nr:GNAT family N-acetyltransferase [Christensenella tenuis]MBC5649278.1 GNAT family N-acetyltransferase [Christensenella tenuis]